MGCSTMAIILTLQKGLEQSAGEFALADKATRKDYEALQIRATSAALSLEARSCVRERFIRTNTLETLSGCVVIADTLLVLVVGCWPLDDAWRETARESSGRQRGGPEQVPAVARRILDIESV
jgi:hypothetical protein